jgi:hypothetical protein
MPDGGFGEELETWARQKGARKAEALAAGKRGPLVEIVTAGLLLRAKMVLMALR